MEMHHEQVYHCSDKNTGCCPTAKDRQDDPARAEAAAFATRPANVLMVGLTLGALLAMQNFVQTAKAQQSNTARQQVIPECNLMEKRAANEPQEGRKTGGRQFVYKGCMADHGQGE